MNPKSTINPLFLSLLTVDPQNDAIIRITVPTSVHSQLNNFSEIVVGQEFVCFDCEFVPPPAEPPPPAVAVRAAVTPPSENRFLQPLSPPDLDDSGGATGYTWHLSIVDNGHPRGDEEVQHGDSTMWLMTTTIGPLTWDGQDLHEARWRLARIGNGKVIGVREDISGLFGDIPITGDYNDDGIDNCGVYYKGEWFIDLDGSRSFDGHDLWAKLGTDDDLPVTGD